MALTVDAAFSTYFNAINLDGDRRSDANARKDHIVGLMKKKFEVLEAFPSGSIPRFTAIKKHADVDVMVALHYGKHIKGKGPKELLQDVRDALGEYKTNVRKNGQAVTLYYDSWPNVNIVPAARCTDNGGAVTHYDIPDVSSGGWISTNPKDHGDDIDRAASACGGNFRKIVKMAKAWNKGHSDYLQSYHVEVMALRALSGSLDDLPWSVFQFFDKASALAKSNLWNRLGYADSYLSQSDRDQAVDRLGKARDGARDAWYAGRQGNEADAVRSWRAVFGDPFPTYG